VTLNFASALCDLEELGIGGGEEEEEEEGMAKARRDEARQVLLTDFCRLIPPDPPYGSFFGFLPLDLLYTRSNTARPTLLHPPRSPSISILPVPTTSTNTPGTTLPGELRFLSQSLVPES